MSQSADKQQTHNTQGCPVTGTAAVGCPVSHQAAEFDPFGNDYQLDPAEALRWSRDQAPAFYSPKLDYWVISRYDDIKAVFRDNITFSPAIALEKITPVSEEAQEALKQYDSQADHRAEHQCGEGKNRPGWRGFVIRFRLDETKATQQTYGQKRHITPDD